MSDETPNVHIRVHQFDCEHCAALREQHGPGVAVCPEATAQLRPDAT